MGKMHHRTANEFDETQDRDAYGMGWRLKVGWSVAAAVTVLLFLLTNFGTIYFLNKPNDGSLSLSDEINVDFAEMVKI